MMIDTFDVPGRSIKWLSTSQSKIYPTRIIDIFRVVSAIIKYMECFDNKDSKCSGVVRLINIKLLLFLYSSACSQNTFWYFTTLRISMTYKFPGMFVVCKYIAVVWSMVLPSYLQQSRGSNPNKVRRQTGRQLFNYP